MSNINLNLIYDEEENQNRLEHILKTQNNDPFVKILSDNDKKIIINETCTILGSAGENLGEYYLNDIFTHLKAHYPFIVTVPEKYKKNVIENGEMIPVAPSDEPGRFGFKGTLGKIPYIDNDEKRYVIEIFTNKKNTLYPHLTGPHRTFRGVCFMPLPAYERLKIDEDYQVLGLYSKKDIENMQNTKKTIGRLDIDNIFPEKKDIPSTENNVIHFKTRVNHITQKREKQQSQVA